VKVPGTITSITTGTTAVIIPTSMVTMVEALCFTTLTSLSHSSSGNSLLTASPALAPKII
jgi:hypothetical protein